MEPQGLPRLSQLKKALLLSPHGPHVVISPKFSRKARNSNLCIKSLDFYMHASQLHQTFCDPVDYSPAGSSVDGISQARVLECVTVSFPRGSSDPGIEPLSLVSPALTGKFPYHWRYLGIFFIYWQQIPSFLKHLSKPRLWGVWGPGAVNVVISALNL